jgi:two-component system, OmpR family, catabolic regulation response regulator CreB
MKILVVEDDPGILEVLEYALRADGHDVRSVARGAEAIERAVGMDCVILDVGLPDMDGFEVCRRLRRVSEVPVVFLTARSEEIDRVVGLEIGADDYVAKPFSTRELLARIKAVRRRLDRTPAAAGGLQIDVDRHAVTWRGQAVDLSRMEFELLAVLAAQPGRVFTRAQLLDRAWPDGGCVTDRTVDAHIKSLRRKFSGADLIETIRGVGYRLRMAEPEAPSAQ